MDNHLKCKMDEMLEPKDTEWLNGYKNKTQINLWPGSPRKERGPK